MNKFFFSLVLLSSFGLMASDDVPGAANDNLEALRSAINQKAYAAEQSASLAAGYARAADVSARTAADYFNKLGRHVEQAKQHADTAGQYSHHVFTTYSGLSDTFQLHKSVNEIKDLKKEIVFFKDCITLTGITLAGYATYKFVNSDLASKVIPCGKTGKTIAKVVTVFGFGAAGLTVLSRMYNGNPWE